jgi:hypothetical protein
MSTTPAAVPMTQAVKEKQRKRSNNPWQPPTRHSSLETFVLKIVHGDTNVAHEINILKKIKGVDCVHLPELVWAPPGDKQLGIVPHGTSIDFRQTASVSRKIVRGLVDGLEHLHLQGIVHWDIRLSNLVLNRHHNVVIIDYETSVMLNDTDVEYLGGFICWPKRLLEFNVARYKPEPTDDLLAGILVVLHLLFPSRFEAFRASSVRVCLDVEQERTLETEQLLALWREIEQSKVWGSFVEAAKHRDYKRLKDMAEVFCHF